METCFFFKQYTFLKDLCPAVDLISILTYLIIIIFITDTVITSIDICSVWEFC